MYKIGWLIHTEFDLYILENQDNIQIFSSTDLVSYVHVLPTEFADEKTRRRTDFIVNSNAKPCKKWLRVENFFAISNDSVAGRSIVIMWLIVNNTIFRSFLMSYFLTNYRITFLKQLSDLLPVVDTLIRFMLVILIIYEINNLLAKFLVKFCW